MGVECPSDFGANLVQHFMLAYSQCSRYRTKSHDKATISHDIHDKTIGVHMEKMKYYEDLSHGSVLAYDEETEFFVIYSPKSGEWGDCKFSFLKFKHDYNFREISLEDAVSKTNGLLPEVKYKEYTAVLDRNRK